jgi:hypothetical protein
MFHTGGLVSRRGLSRPARLFDNSIKREAPGLTARRTS